MQIAHAMILASGALHAVINAILKAGKDKLAGRALIDASGALFVAPAVVFVPLPHGAWAHLCASTLVHLVYLYALVRSFEVGDLSAAYPVARGTAPLVTASVTLGFLGERASGMELAGMALIGAGIFAMASAGSTSAAALRWSLLVGLTIAAYTMIDARGVRAAPTAASYVVWTFLFLGVSLTTFFSLLRGRALLRAAAEQWRPGVVAGALSIGSYGLALGAYRLGGTAQLAALREVSIVVAAIIAFAWLKERVTPRRFAAALTIATGAAIVTAA